MGRTTALTGSHIGELRVKADCILRKLRIRCVICGRKFYEQDLHKLGLSFVSAQYMRKILSSMCAIYALDLTRLYFFPNEQYMRKICARLYFFPQCAICEQDLRKIVLLSPMRNICTRFVQDCASLPNAQYTLIFSKETRL